MSFIHKQMAWGGIVGITLLGCIAGCSSLKEEPMLLLPLSQARQKAAPTPAPQAHERAALTPAPQAKEEVAPAGKPEITQVGTASWYGPGFQGQETASGETFDQHALTAAHRTLPLGTEAKVTNLETGQSVTVTINDRGPYVQGRQLDLSQAAAKQIGLTKKKGVVKVKIETKRPRSRRRPLRRVPAQHKSDSTQRRGASRDLPRHL
jgi:rare lipoprotein A (peptidoglycan hydrolase)